MLGVSVELPGMLPGGGVGGAWGPLSSMARAARFTLPLAGGGGGGGGGVT